MTRMSHSISGELEARSPFRTPDWRWRCAADLVVAGAETQPTDDVWITLAVEYQRAMVEEAGQRALTGPLLGVAAAHQLHVSGGQIADEVSARLLAGQRFDEISTITKVPVAVISAFEALFFQVADAVRDGAWHWLMEHAVGFGPWMPCVPTEGQAWRFLALTGGPHIVDVVIADFLGRDEPRFPNRHELAEKGRYLAREYATDWSSPRAAAAIIEEGCQRFGAAIRRRQRSDPLLGVQVNWLRRRAGLAPIPLADERRADSRGPSTAAKEVQNETHSEVQAP